MSAELANIQTGYFCEKYKTWCDVASTKCEKFFGHEKAIVRLNEAEIKMYWDVSILTICFGCSYCTWRHLPYHLGFGDFIDPGALEEDT